MTLAEQIARQIERTVDGPMWHGPALAEVLAGVTAEQAAARPIPGAHTIWELVLHAATWATIARARLDGRAIEDPPDDLNFPPIPDTGAAAWDAAVERLRESHRALAARVRSMNDAALDRPVATLPYAAWTLLHGVVEHGTYHGGQIALLRRALRS